MMEYNMATILESKMAAISGFISTYEELKKKFQKALNPLP